MSSISNDPPDERDAGVEEEENENGMAELAATLRKVSHEMLVRKYTEYFAGPDATTESFKAWKELIETKIMCTQILNRILLSSAPRNLYVEAVGLAVRLDADFTKETGIRGLPLNGFNPKTVYNKNAKSNSPIYHPTNKKFRQKPTTTKWVPPVPYSKSVNVRFHCTSCLIGDSYRQVCEPIGGGKNRFHFGGMYANYWRAGKAEIKQRLGLCSEERVEKEAKKWLLPEEFFKYMAIAYDEGLPSSMPATGYKPYHKVEVRTKGTELYPANSPQNTPFGHFYMAADAGMAVDVRHWTTKKKPILDKFNFPNYSSYLDAFTEEVFLRKLEIGRTMPVFALDNPNVPFSFEDWLAEGRTGVE